MSRFRSSSPNWLSGNRVILPMVLPREIAAMRRAVALSAHGLGTTSPNPPVGCVILDSRGEVVGEGFHYRKGESHAEVNALTAAGDAARGGTAVVTLEPCNHQGRTPPCRQALIDAGVARVVIALMDPTSREEGGAARLRAAGVDVEEGVLGHEALLVLGPWMRSLQTKLPFVRWLDGDDDVESLSEFASLRAASDAVVFPDGRIEEGVIGVHLPDVFTLPAAYKSQRPESFLRELYDRGVRSVLLAGRSAAARSFYDADLVDEIVLLIEERPASEGLGSGSWVDRYSGAFEATDVGKSPAGVRMVFVRRSDD